MDKYIKKIIMDYTHPLIKQDTDSDFEKYTINCVEIWQLIKLTFLKPLIALGLIRQALD